MFYLQIPLSILSLVVFATAVPRQPAAHKRYSPPHVGGNPDWNHDNPGWNGPWLADNPWANNGDGNNNNNYGQQGPAQYRAQAVKDAFQFAWDGYYQYAFPVRSLLAQKNPIWY